MLIFGHMVQRVWNVPIVRSVE